MVFKSISLLISVGMTLVFVGLTWSVFDGIITNYIIPKYWISTVYLEVMQMEFNAIPTIMLIIGIILCVVGVGSHRSVSV